ncbi:hypothetical protein B0T18DRAFT_393758 [Schizothecium vesticola]|uniref:Uncharacterized protein n=1 Tax=Schizothecium vesticola TaxID=314040 RepID=A0AA40EKL8_9PEZI|nr:hypothetical protein B0T18DRAFT_393758 [Schizothecium vesticola]
MPPKRGRPKKASTPPPAPVEDEAPAPVAAPRGRGRPRKVQPSGDPEQTTAPTPKTPKEGPPTTTRVTRAQAQAQAEGGAPITGAVAVAPNPGQTKTRISAHTSKAPTVGRKPGCPGETPVAVTEEAGEPNVNASDNADGNDDGDVDEDDTKQPAFIAPRKRGRPPKAKPNPLAAQPMPEKRGRGRPPKDKANLSPVEATPAKRGRGRPRKTPLPEPGPPAPEKRGPGRPPKTKNLKRSPSPSPASAPPPAKRGRGRPPKPKPAPLIPKLFNLNFALGSYRVTCPAIAATLDKPTSFDLDICSLLPFHASEILTASFDFSSFTGTLRGAVDSTTLTSYLTSQQGAPIAAVVLDLEPPAAAAVFLSPAPLHLALRGRKTTDGTDFESLQGGTLKFQDNTCAAFTAVAMFPGVGEVEFEGVKDRGGYEWSGAIFGPFS